MPPPVVEGTWEEVLNHASELTGHRLRVYILPDENDSSSEVRLESLNAWLNLPRTKRPTVLDDSRSAIYGEDLDRG